MFLHAIALYKQVKGFLRFFRPFVSEKIGPLSEWLCRLYQRMVNYV